MYQVNAGWLWPLTTPAGLAKGLFNLAYQSQRESLTWINARTTQSTLVTNSSKPCPVHIKANLNP